MITDTIADIVEQHIGPMQTAIGLDWHVTIGAAATPDGRVGLAAQFFFVCKSPLLGQRLWEVAPPMAADLALDPIVVGRLVRSVTEHFANVRAELAKTPALEVR